MAGYLEELHRDEEDRHFVSNLCEIRHDAYRRCAEPTPGVMLGVGNESR